MNNLSADARTGLALLHLDGMAGVLGLLYSLNAVYEREYPAILEAMIGHRDELYGG